MPEPTRPYLTPAEVGREIDMSADGVRKLVRKGQLKALRLSARKIVIPRPALAAYQRRVNGERPVEFQMPAVGDPDELAREFQEATGRDPAGWIAAWKGDEIEDSADNMALMAQASAICAALMQRSESPTGQAVAAA